MDLLEKLERHKREYFVVEEIKLEGNQVTKQDLINHYLSDVKQGGNIQNILFSINSALIKLRSLGIFQSIDVTLEFPNSELQSQDVAHKINLLVKIQEKHRREFSISRNWTPTTGASDWQIGGQLLNALGRGESLSLNFSANSTLSRTYFANYTKPLILMFSPDLFPFPKFTTQVSRHIDNQSGTSRYIENVNGFSTILNYLSHTIDWEVAWRNVLPESQASMNVRQHAGDSLKSSIRYSYKFDRRDDPLVPSQGYLVSFFSEFAGLGGNVKYWKEEVVGQLHLPLGGSGLSLGFQLRGGIMNPLYGDTIRINDRFYLGGPNLFRGFEFRGVGPFKLQNESLGGEIYFAGGTNLTFPLVTQLSGNLSSIFGHVFFNFGNLSSVNQVFSSSVKNLLSNEVRSSLGIGLIFRTPIGRIEVNFNSPLKTCPLDRSQRWQIGFFSEF